METCDQAGCTARATRTVYFDNDLSLVFCGHDAAQLFPWIDAEVRWSLDHCLIVT